jgi:hypothetical protein
VTLEQDEATETLRRRLAQLPKHLSNSVTDQSWQAEVLRLKSTMLY